MILRVCGGRKLSGSVAVQGAKNSVLPIMAASVLARGESVIHNCPDLRDVDVSIRILEYLGCSVKREGSTVCIDSSGLMNCGIPDALMREMRSSVVFMGAILARCGGADLTYPGGCELGARPIDMHLEALRSLGAEIEETGGNIRCRALNMRGRSINLPFPSVGATENAMLAATACSGVTEIINAAREPEIEDLQAYLRAIGFEVCGAGSAAVSVCGGKSSGGAEHTIIPDRIAAATYMAAVASAGGEAEIRKTEPRHCLRVMETLAEAGCDIRSTADSVRIARRGELKAVRPVITKPHPGFPTDAQPPLMAASLGFAGTTVFVENIFESRYRHVPELRRMGADIRTEGRVALVCGPNRLHGASVEATDLRGGAALVVAALAAEGESGISKLTHLDRGYERIENALGELGADIKRDFE